MKVCREWVGDEAFIARVRGDVLSWETPYEMVDWERRMLGGAFGC